MVLEGWFWVGLAQINASLWILVCKMWRKSICGGHTEFSFVAQNYMWGYILICKLIAKCFGGSLTYSGSVDLLTNIYDKENKGVKMRRKRSPLVDRVIY